jgi:putative transposase
MKKSRYTESKIIAMLKDVDANRKVEQMCRQHSISNSIFSIGVACIPVAT